MSLLEGKLGGLLKAPTREAQCPPRRAGPPPRELAAKPPFAVHLGPSLRTMNEAHPDIPPIPVDSETPQAELPPAMREDPITPLLALFLNSILGTVVVLVFYQVALRYLAGIETLLPTAEAEPGATADLFRWIADTYVATLDPIRGETYQAPLFAILATVGGLLMFALSSVLLRRTDLGESAHTIQGLSILAAILGAWILGLAGIWLALGVGIATMVWSSRRYVRD